MLKINTTLSPGIMDVIISTKSYEATLSRYTYSDWTQRCISHMQYIYEVGRDAHKRVKFVKFNRLKSRGQIDVYVIDNVLIKSRHGCIAAGD